MPKLPVLKARKFLRFVQKEGFIKHHQAGSHMQLKHADGRRITIPYHPSQELRRGTLRGIISDMDLTVEEFIERLKKAK